MWHSSRVPILMVWKDVQQPWSPKRFRVTVLALMAGAEGLHLAGEVLVLAVLVLAVLVLALRTELVLPPEPMPVGILVVITKLCQLPLLSAQHCAALVRPTFCTEPWQFWPEYMRIWMPLLNMVLSTAWTKLLRG